MKNISNIFERIDQIRQEKNFESINDFALNGLGYKSSQKINRLKNPKNNPSVDILMDISNKFGYSIDWMLFGDEFSKRNIQKMLQNKTVTKTVTFDPETKSSENVTLIEDPVKGIPLIPLDAMAGFGEGETQVMDYEVSRYVVPEFTELHVDFMIRVKGSSMYPKYSSGDIVACRKLSPNDLFFQWNKVYVLDTAQGPLIKRIRKGADKEHILIVSENERYAPFELPLNEITAVALVCGVIRLE